MPNGSVRRRLRSAPPRGTYKSAAAVSCCADPCALAAAQGLRLSRSSFVTDACARRIAVGLDVGREGGSETVRSHRNGCWRSKERLLVDCGKSMQPGCLERRTSKLVALQLQVFPLMRFGGRVGLLQPVYQALATALILTVDQLITFAPALYMTHLTE